MKLENQVCSLDLAKRLKKLGVKEYSYFWWVYRHSKWVLWDASQMGDYADSADEEEISAYNVAELGEMLPREIVKNGKVKTMSIGRTPGLPCWYVSFGHTEKSAILVEAMAKVMVYLLENKLLTTLSTKAELKHQ